MADERELKQEFMGVVEQLRTENEASLKSLKGIGEKTGETKAAMAKIEADLIKLSRDIDDAANKANRPPTTTPLLNEAEKKGFNNYVRKGDYQILSDSTGGYTVPDLMSDEIIRLMQPYDPIRAMGRVITISGGSPLNIPHITTNQTGGFVAETATRSTKNAAIMEQRVITPHAMYTNITASNAILQDSAYDIERFIVDEAAKSFAYYEGAAFVHGDGSGQPYGIMDDTTVLANAVTSVTNDLTNADDYVQLPFKLATQYLQSGAKLGYILNRATMAAAMVLKEGSSGSVGKYYFHPTPNGPYHWTFNGYPVYLSDSMSDVANGAYVALFGDFSQYWIVDVAGSMRMLRDPYTSKGNVVFHIERRVGGNVADPGAFSVLVIQ